MGIEAILSTSQTFNFSYQKSFSGGLHHSSFNSLRDVRCEISCPVSTAGAEQLKHYSHQRDNWVTEGRRGSTLLVNIGLLSAVSTFKLSSQLEVQEYKYWKSLKGFTISVNKISLEGLYKINNKISDRDNRRTK